MGYREDVVYVYSAEGWNQLLSAIKGMDDAYAKKLVVDLINEADRTLLSSDGCRFLKFDSIKVYSTDFEAYVNVHSNMDQDGYLGLYLGEDGAEDWVGGFWDNPFSLGVTRAITFDEAGDDVISPMIDELNMGYDKPTIPAPAVDDHTCPACGNTKCSKTEKSCWKCGAPI